MNEITESEPDWMSVAQESLEQSSEDAERTLELNPSDVKTRVRLLSYYFTKSLGTDANIRRVEHAKWMISHFPRAAVNVVGGVNQTWLNALPKLASLWMKALTDNSDDRVVLRNAALFFLGYDRVQAERLIRIGQEIEQGVPFWPGSLGVLRSLDWVDSKDAESRPRLAEEALCEYERAICNEQRALERLSLLCDIGRCILWSGKVVRASTFASIIVSLSAGVPAGFLTIRARHIVHVLIGHDKLSRDDVAGARNELGEAAASSFGAGELLGPDFTLAARLLAQGETVAVLAYLQSTAKSWPHSGKLAEWKADIEAGRMPSFKL